MDFEVQRCTRKCAATERELQPGESFYSVLIRDGVDIRRLDYTAEAWEGPPENAIGHWRSQMPDPKVRKVDWAPNDVILHYFIELAERPEAADTRYVLALLMIRRRLLRLEETEKNQKGGETMVLFCSRNEAEYRITVRDPSPDRIVAIQDELANLLFGKSE